VFEERRVAVADGEGFEPPRGVNLCRFSRPVLLTTQPSVRTQVQ
jgi:hypothetical protein